MLRSGPLSTLAAALWWEGRREGGREGEGEREGGRVSIRELIGQL